MPIQGTALELRNDGALASVEASAQAGLDAAVAQGLVSTDLLEFGHAVTEEGRVASLVLPLYTLFSRHAILRTLDTPDEAPDTAYTVIVRGGKLEEDVKEWHLKKQSGIGNTAYEYVEKHKGNRLGIASPYLAASSPEELEKMAAWKREQAERLKALESEGPLGAASALVESAYGGIDITDPQRAVRELAARALTSAIITKEHKGFGFESGEIIDSRLVRMFSVITGPYHGAYREFTEKMLSAASMVTVKGLVEPARFSVVSEMVSEDTANFLEQVWADLGRLVAVERVGWGQVRRLEKLLHGG